MSDSEQDILFTMRTEGETEGAEKVQEAIADTGEAAKKAGESAQQADPQLGQLINIQRAQVASQIANALGQVGGAVRGMAEDFKTSDKELSKTLEDTATGIDSLTGALGGAAQGFAVGGPMGAAIGGMIGLMSGPLKDAYQDMIESLDAAAQAEARAKEQSEKLAIARAKFADQVRQEKLEAVFKGQSDELDRQVGLIQTLSRLNDAKREADAAVQDATAPAATPEQQVSRDLGRDLANIDAKVQEAAQLAERSASFAQDAINNVQRVYASEGRASNLLIQAKGERDAAIRQAEIAQTKADELAATAEAEKQKARAGAIEKLTSLGDTFDSAITENANTVIRTIQQVAAQQGGRLEGDAKGALDQLVRMVSDLIPDEQQTAAFQQAIQQFRGSQDAAQNHLVQTVDGILANNRELIAKMAARDAEILRQTREIQDADKRFAEKLSALR